MRLRSRIRFLFKRLLLPAPLRDVPGMSIREKMIALIKHELRAHRSPVKIALSLSAGVGMGLMPIHGLQVFSLLGLTFLLRLNRPVALVGVNISCAPFLPFWIAAGVGIGNALIPDSIAIPLAAGLEEHLPVFFLGWIESLPFEGVLTGFVKWFAGSTVLAVVCSLLTFITSLPLIKGLQYHRHRHRTGSHSG
jgi:uncharacterized protein (DUF2062 family)